MAKTQAGFEATSHDWTMTSSRVNMCDVIEADWSIRSLGISELPAVMEIERQGYSHPWSEAVFRDCFRPQYQLWAMCRRDRLVGYAIVAELFDEAHLLNLCVEPASRSHGAGRHLLQYLTREAFASGMDRILLEARVSNEAAIALYQSEGFDQIGLRPGYYPGGGASEAGAREDALVFALEAVLHRQP